MRLLTNQTSPIMKPSARFALLLGLFASFAQAEMAKPTPHAPVPKAATSETPVPKKPAVPKESAESRLAALKKEAAALTPDQTSKFLQLLNQGDDKGLQEIKGIGKARSAAIIAKRPYATVEDLAKVESINSSAYPAIITFAKGEQPTAAPKKAAAGTMPK